MSNTAPTARSTKRKRSAAASSPSLEGSGSAPLATPGKDLPPVARDQMLDPDECELMPGQQHAAKDIEELADSIVLFGQIHAGDVFRVSEGVLWIVAGRRRWLACQARRCLYRADVYDCRDLDKTAMEDLARRLRLTENDQREDPSAYHVAVQLRTIRNERGLPTNRALATELAMSESRVKMYTGIFQGSDRLLDAAEKHQLAIGVVAELVRAEKQLGEAKTRALIRQAVAGELTAADIKRKRRIARHGARSATRKARQSDFDSAARRLLRLLDQDPQAHSTALAELIAQLKLRRDKASPSESRR